MEKNVWVSPRHAQKGITENHRGYPTEKNIRVFGGDTETVKGKAYTFQLCSEGEEIIERIDSDSIFKRIMQWLHGRVLEGGVNIVWFHNLRFDLTVIFQNQAQTLYEQYNDIRFELQGYVVKMFYGRVNMAQIWEDRGGYWCPKCKEIPSSAIRILDHKKICGNPKHPVRAVRRNLGPCVRFLDSAAFCPPGSKSLSAALKIYGVSYRKLDAPADLGMRPLWDDSFKEYALNDARAEEALGLKILELHKEYDITPSISLPQLSARILRHHFFRPGESLQFPPADCQEASELSYHAGKNGFYVKRGCYDNLYEYDINSAFPKAMRDMPQLVKGEYKHVRQYNPHVLGLYLCDGRRKSGRYPIVFDHAFRPIQGIFKDVWITGYELSILRCSPDYDQLKIKSGWIWRPDRNYKHSPLKEFVEQFWKLKSDTPKGPQRDTYKNIMNSLYGKFAACREVRDVVDTAFGPVDVSKERGKYYVAGALYHPFIATQITGYVRRELYLLEQRGKAFHSATDSIKSKLDLPTSDDLGGIKKEVFGRCYLFRNKLYLHFAKDNKLCGHDLEGGWLYVSKENLGTLPNVGRGHVTGKAWCPDGEIWRGKLFDRGGQHLCKYGLHGYKGDVYRLYMERDALLRDGYLDYEYDHMVSLREGIIRGETVCDMTHRKERLQLEPCN
jgi:hypothetical protein